MGVDKKAKQQINSWNTAGQADVSQGYQDLGGYMRGQTDRAGNLWNTNQDWGLGELRGIYDDIGSGGGGGGGVPGYGGELDASKAWWQQVADTGWRTPEQKEGGWGWGNFKNFAQTGGWSDPEKADFRARGLAGVPQFYDQMRGELARGKTVQGGYGPGLTTANMAVARDRAKALGESRLGIETSLADSIRKGKMWGSEQGTGAASRELGNMTNAQGQIDSIQQQIMAANARAAASRAGGADRDLAMRLGIIDRVTGLAKDTGGDLAYGGAWGSALAGRTGADATYSGTTAAANTGKDFWDKLSTVGSLASGVGGLIPRKG